MIGTITEDQITDQVDTRTYYTDLRHTAVNNSSMSQIGDGRAVGNETITKQCFFQVLVYVIINRYFIIFVTCFGSCRPSSRMASYKGIH